MRDLQPFSKQLADGHRINTGHELTGYLKPVGEGISEIVRTCCKPGPQCACATNRDGSVTTFLCPVHADVDPCYTRSRVTGKRRTGTIRRGVCTNCGHTSK